MIKLLRSYIFWTYERGSFHYDVMVTAILSFVFVGPLFIDFNGKPVETVTLDASEVIVKEAGTEGTTDDFIYQIRADTWVPRHQTRTSAPPFSRDRADPGDVTFRSL